MYQHDFADVRKNMDVYDRNGDKVGTVGEVYSMTEVRATTSSASRATTDGYMKVDTGFLKLGKDLYVPSRAVRSVQDDRVTLDVDKATIDTFGWDEKPSTLRD